MKPSIHWLDSNVFIQAKNGPYAFARVPQFWIFLSEQLEQGNVRSPKMVYDELVGGNDDLAVWFKPRREKGLCHHPNETVQQCYGNVANHVAMKFKPHQAAEFLVGADGWIIAHAMDGDGVVVTQESDRSHKSKIKIPTICKVFGVRCVNTYQMLDALGADLS
jgi:hypothetical protein